MRFPYLELLTEGVLLIAVVAAPLLILTMVVSDLLTSSRSAVLMVDGLCCSHAAYEAEYHLGTVEGVKRCVADRKSQLLRIVLHDASLSTLQAVWDVAEQNSLRPTRMIFRGQDILDKREN